MSNRIALSVIAGDDINKDNGIGLRRLIESAKNHIDKIFISFNGKDTETIIEIVQLYEGKVVIDLTTWVDDFAFARNQAFDMIPKDEFDWIMWADSDDTIEGLHSLNSMLDSLDPKTQAVMLKYDYATDEATGSVLAEQWRERLFRTDLNGTWIYPLHELYRLPFGTQIARRGDVWVKHWREEPRGELVRNDGTRERNRRILTKAMRENPDDTRLSYYFANEIYAEAAIAVNDESISDDEADAICDAAIVAYENFIPDAPSPDDAYIATHQIAELFRLKKAYLQAIDTDMQAMMILPHWPEAWVGVAQSYLELKDWDKAIFFANACLKVTTNPETTQVREPLAGKYLPLLVIAIAQENKGEYRSAIDTYNDLIEFDRDNELSKKITELKQQLKLEEEAKNAVPETSLREEMYGTQPEKSIAFFLRPSVEQWSSRSIKEGGIGGTETAVCEVAKRFASKGWRTVVFGSPPEDIYDTVYDGIEWYNSTDLSLTEEFTVFVSLRTPEVFDANISAKLKVLWMHDVNTGENFTEPSGKNRVENIDIIAGVSKWHCSHMRKLYDIPEEKLVVLPNGINLERFLGKEVERQKNRYIWSSSPDRGLDVVLDMWPEIRKIQPDATLNIYYGWNNYDKVVEYTQDYWMKIFKDGIYHRLEELKDSGVTWHGRIDQDQLAEEFMRSEYQFYPGYFLETNFIGGLEAQAGGCIPIISNAGGAPENMSEVAVLLDGWPNNFTYRKEALRKIKELTKLDEQVKEDDRAIMREFVQYKTWDRQFANWLSLIGRIENV